jgi:hypothetical protein
MTLENSRAMRERLVKQLRQESRSGGDPKVSEQVMELWWDTREWLERKECDRVQQQLCVSLKSFFAGGTQGQGGSGRSVWCGLVWVGLVWLGLVWFASRLCRWWWGRWQFQWYWWWLS